MKRDRLVDVVAGALCVFCLLTLCCCATSEQATHEKGAVSMWTNHDGLSYRIPGIIRTDDGALIAYCEERRGTGDWSDINIVERISRDAGVSWTDSRVIVNGIDDGLTVNNPVMIPDGSRIHLLYEIEYGLPSKGGGVYHCYSDDCGESWSTPKQILQDADFCNVIATGPGHGIKSSKGDLLVPVWFVLKSSGSKEASHHPGSVATLYSEDQGASWHIGEIIPAGDVVDPNESAMVELSDGSFLLNARNGSDQKLRAVSRSKNGKDGWSSMKFDPALADPTCFGSLCRCEDGTILFVNCDSTDTRTALTVRSSGDDCASWSGKALACEDGGYADVVAIGEEVLVLAEHKGEDGFFISLERLSRAQLKR